jgi:hypothetical protein
MNPKEKEGKLPERWRRSLVLRDDAYEAWRKEGGVLNPSSVIATTDEDGAPRTAPFGSLHALTPDRLRVVIHRYHDTLKNIHRDGRVMVAMVTPPDIAISVKGQGRVVEDPWKGDERYAIVEIDVQEVKNDLPMQIGVEGGITISATGPFQEWWRSSWEKLHSVQ